MFGGNSKMRFYEKRPGWENWCLNGQQCGTIGQWLPQVDRAFNVHRFALLKQYGYSFDAEASWVRENPTTPFITLDKWPKYMVPDWCRGELYPLQAMLKSKMFPRPMYHCGSFDWMVAYAIFCGFTHIEIHGINLRLEASEPGSSQSCLEYWCGFAEARGIKITSTPDATMFFYSHITLTNRTYGWDDAPVYVDDRIGGMKQYDYKP